MQTKAHVVIFAEGNWQVGLGKSLTYWHIVQRTTGVCDFTTHTAELRLPWSISMKAAALQVAPTSDLWQGVSNISQYNITDTNVLRVLCIFVTVNLFSVQEGHERKCPPVVILFFLSNIQLFNGSKWTWTLHPQPKTCPLLFRVFTCQWQGLTRLLPSSKAPCERLIQSCLKQLPQPGTVLSAPVTFYPICVLRARVCHGCRYGDKQLLTAAWWLA